MADDDANDSQTLTGGDITGGDITQYRALVARISSSPQCRIVVRWQNHRCVTWSVSRGSARYLAGKPRAKCWFRWQQSGELEAHSAGVIMRGGHCLKVWTKKQQVVSLSSAESELYAAVNTASEGLGIQSVARDLGILFGLNLYLNASATMCLVNRRGLGKAKHVDMQNLWIQEASKASGFIKKKVGTSVNPADLMTKPLPKTR